jgi:MFS family permease
MVQVVVLLLSTLLMGVASSFELTARNKYSALLVDRPEQLAPYLASFSVVFNVGKLVGPPLGGWLVALTAPSTALAIDAATYLVPIASVIWLLHPHRGNEQLSGGGEGASLLTAWKECGSTLRHVLALHSPVLPGGLLPSRPGSADFGRGAGTISPGPGHLHQRARRRQHHRGADAAAQQCLAE